MSHVTSTELLAGEAGVQQAPADVGTVDMIVRRPDLGAREVIDVGHLLVGAGLEGDNYVARGSSKTPDGTAHPQGQLNLMRSRAVDLVAGGDRSLWPLAGDQFFVDFDLSTTNLPAGTRLEIGDAVIEVAAKPHTGCAKFADRYGMDAARWVNSSNEHRYRGINAMVIQAGDVRTGDAIRKVPTD